MIKKILKKYLPSSVKQVLKKVSSKIYKKYLVRKMRVFHKKELARLTEKDKVRVVFLAFNASLWKVDNVFQKMMIDPFFEPIILVCPYDIHNNFSVSEDMNEAYDYFISKNYAVISAFNSKTQEWLKLEEISPDIVFFTSPHDLTRHEYYEAAFLNYLSCYVPYSHDISKYDNYSSQYDQLFHNVMWRIFAPHNEDLEIFRQYSYTKGINVIVTGYPFCESFFGEVGLSPWKHQEKNKCRVIWAPHHTIDDPHLPYSSFLSNAEFFKAIAMEMEDKIQFAFKPHPLLKSKLYLSEGWGKERTDSYYKFWSSNDNTQLVDSNYVELFQNSDAMIHDSGSFLAEYHYVQKPVFYICNSAITDFLNPFGILALESCYRGETQDELYGFLTNLVSNAISVKREFYQIVKPYYDEPPSKKIIHHLKMKIQGEY